MKKIVSSLSGQNIASKASGFIIANPKGILVVFFLLTIFFAYLIPMVPMEESFESFIMENDPDLIYFKKWKKQFGSGEFIVVALSQKSGAGDRGENLAGRRIPVSGADSLGVFTPEMLKLIDRLTRRIEALEDIQRVISLTNVNDVVGKDEDFIVERLIKEIPKDSDQLSRIKEKALTNPIFANDLISEDGRTTAIVIKIKDKPGDDAYRNILVEKVQAILNEEKAPGEGFYVAGSPIIDYYSIVFMDKDLRTFLPLAFLMIVFVLFFVFRSWVGVLLSILSILVTLVWTMGFLYIEGGTINNVTTMIPPLMMVLSGAVVIHFLTEYRHYSHSFERKEAVSRAIKDLFLPCLLCVITTGVGFGSLGVSPVPPIRDFGVVAAAGQIFSFLSALFLVPSVLLMVRRKEAGQGPSCVGKGQKRREDIELTMMLKFLRRDERTKRDAMDKFILLVIGVVKRWHRHILVLTFIILVFSVWGLMRMDVETNFLEYFKKKSHVYRSTDFIQKNLNGVQSIEISIEAEERDAFKDPDLLHRVARLEKFLESQPEVTKVMSIVPYIKEIYRSFNNEREEFYRIPETREMVAQLLFLYDATDIQDYVDNDYRWITVTARVKEHSSRKLRDLSLRIQKYLDFEFGKDQGFGLQGKRIRIVNERGYRGEVEAKITGITALNVKLADYIVSSQIQSLGLALPLIFGMMFILFKSVKIGIVSIVPNIIPLLINFGVMGWAGIPLNIATVMISTIAIGIAVDDTIHFLSSFQGEMKKDLNYAGAIERTLLLKGRAMISTSAIIAIGFGILVLSNFILTIYFGLLTSIIMIVASFADLFFNNSLILTLSREGLDLSSGGPIDKKAMARRGGLRTIEG